MIGIIVEQATGNIRTWYDVSPQDMALQPIPPGHVVVVSDNSPNFKAGENRIVGLKRRPDLDLPGVAMQFYEGTIQKAPPTRTVSDGKNRKKSR